MSEEIGSRIAIVETQIQDVKSDIGEVKDILNGLISNHLPHINQRIDGIKTWLIGVLVSIIITLIGTLTLIFKG